MAPKKWKLQDAVAEYEDFFAKIVETAWNGGDVAKEVIRFHNRTHDAKLIKTMTPTDFTLDGAIRFFGLRYSVVSYSDPWKIEDILETKGFEPT